jgi:sulfur relay protein TusB/DsrH
MALSGIDTVKVLHIIRSNDDSLAQRIIDDMRESDGVEQTLLLIQDGVYMNLQGDRIFACSDDVGARGVKTGVPLVEYDRIVEMTFEHDKVITW